MKKIYYHIEAINGPVIKLKANNIAYGELARIYLSDGSFTFGQVIRLQNQYVSLQVFGGSKGIKTDDRIEFLGKQVELSFDRERL